MKLRPYQERAISEIRQAFADGARAPLLVSPTGSGKTVTFSAIAESSRQRGKRVLILCHRIELVDQIVAALGQFGIEPQIIAADYPYRHGNPHVAVASVQTLIRRLHAVHEPTLIVVDECHHAASGSTWSKILAHYKNAKVLGVTATPARLDGRGLGEHFDRLILGPSVRELIEAGYLAKPRIFSPPTVDTSGLHIRAGEFKAEESESLMDTPRITGDALAHYRKFADELPAIAFCVSVKHAHHVAEDFRRAGISAAALDGTTDKALRQMVVEDFRRGQIKVLANCQLFSEGFDVPGVHAGIFLRPTASLGLWLQQVGRIMRAFDGKPNAILLDHVGNTIRHGLPDDDREWELTADSTSKKKTKQNASCRVCPKCFAATRSGARQCIECGHVFEVESRTVEKVEGELVELTPEQMARKRERREQGRAQSLEQLREFARRKGYAPQWADHVFRARQQKRAAR